MGECQKVILYGDSLLLAAIKSSLANFPSIEVIVQNVSPVSALPDICAMQASVVIFDLTEFPSETVLSLIENQPDMLVIGLEPAGERMLLLSGRDAHTMTTNRLVQLMAHMQQETGGETPKERYNPTGRTPSPKNNNDSGTTS